MSIPFADGSDLSDLQGRLGTNRRQRARAPNGLRLGESRISVQVVFAQVDLPWQELDWSTLTPHMQIRPLEEVLAFSRNEYPDLSKPPLLRCVIARLDSERWQFVLAFHHLLVDGWSLHLVLKRVFDAYEARLAGNNAATTPRRQRSFSRFHLVAPAPRCREGRAVLATQACRTILSNRAADTCALGPVRVPQAVSNRRSQALD